MAERVPASLDIVKDDTDKAIDRLSQYRRSNKKKAEFVVVSSAAISAATTIAIGLTSLISSWSVVFQSLALMLSASLTILTAWDGLYNHKRLWLIQAGVLNSLYRIQADIRHLEKCDPIDQEAVNELYLRYQAAFDEYNSQWSEMRTDERSSSSKSNDDVASPSDERGTPATKKR